MMNAEHSMMCTVLIVVNGYLFLYSLQSSGLSLLYPLHWLLYSPQLLCSVYSWNDRHSVVYNQHSLRSDDHDDWNDIHGA